MSRQTEQPDQAAQMADCRTLCPSVPSSLRPCSPERSDTQNVSIRQAISEERGATMLEWALLLAAIGIPSYWVIRIALDTLIGYYAMMTTLNGLPLP